MRRALPFIVAAVLIAGVGVMLMAPGLASGGSGTTLSSPAQPSKLVAAGRQLYITGCSSCHGMQAGGTRGVAPSLRGVGASAADFELTTGRMPLSRLDSEPMRGQPRYDATQIRALDAYIGSLGGPSVPHVGLAGGSLALGQQLFTATCAGCHQIAARGGIVTGASVPPLTSATPTQIAEAIRVGPYLMPRFGPQQLGDHDIASIARFVVSTRHPSSPGGAGIGYLGPVPEGMVTWLLALPVLLIVTRLIGRRAER